MAKISMSSDKLKTMLETVSPAVGSGIDSAPSIIITVKDGGEWVCAEAHNYEISILTEDFEIDKDKSVDGEMSVAADWILNAKNKLPSETVTMEQKGDFVTLKSGRFRTVGECVDPFRSLNFVENTKGQYISIDRKSFARGLEVASSSMPKNDFRAILNGVNISIYNDSLLFTATDGHKASRYTCNEYDTKIEDLSVIVPFKSVSFLIKLLKSCDITEDVDVYINNNNMHLITGEGTHLITVFTYGTYPDCNPLFNENDGIDRVCIKVNRKDMIDTIDRVRSIGKDKKIASLKFESDENSNVVNILLYENNMVSKRKSNDVIDVTRLEGDDRNNGVIDARYNPEYLIDILNASSVEQIIFKIGNTTVQGKSMIEFMEDEFTRCALMGMKI